MTTPSPSACHRVLSIPTLLSDILSYIRADTEGAWNGCPNLSSASEPTDDDDDDDDHWCSACKWFYALGALMRCALVNKYWFHETVRVLWRKPHAFRIDHRTTLLAHMARIAPDRRQMYADKIVVGSLNADGGCDAKEAAALKDVSFPRLRKVQMALSGGDVAPMRAPSVEIVELDPHYEPCYPEMFGVSQDQMESVFDSVAEAFPNAREVRVIDRCLVHIGGVEKFKAKMKNLQVWEGGMVLETEVSGWDLATWEGGGGL